MCVVGVVERRVVLRVVNQIPVVELRRRILALNGALVFLIDTVKKSADAHIGLPTCKHNC